ncbi:MFS transporter [Kaistia granuli]|uniref:MFS transporter n=1 Tax=Kaistia granuli TaxID=363259 RepID=UPI000476C82C|nr:MFS transporter [Kaistia granuli]
MEQAEPSPVERKQRGLAVTLALSVLLASLGTSIANIALPALAGAFAAPFAHVQGVVVGYLAALAISVVFAGRLGDRHGLKRMLVIGIGLFAASALLCGMAPNLWLLIIARALQGIGAAFLMTLPMALMRQAVGRERMGRAMGLLGTVSALGTALGPSLGGLLIPITGWRGVFWIQVPLAVLALYLACATLAAPNGAARGPAKGARSLPGWSLLPSLAVNLLVAAVMMTTLVVGPFLLGLGLGLQEATIGLVVAIGPVVSIVSGVPSGRLVDGWGSRRVLVVGLVLLGAGAFLLALLPEWIGLGGYVLAIVILTPGYQLFQAANNAAVLADVEPDRRGAVSGWLALSRNLGLIVGASLMGGVFAFGVGTDDLIHAAPDAITAGTRLTFLVAGVMIMLALAAVFRLGAGSE